MVLPMGCILELIAFNLERTVESTTVANMAESLEVF